MTVTVPAVPDELTELTSDHDKASAALHEGGHGLAGTILPGISVRYATLKARDGGAQVVLREQRRGWPVMEFITVNCAGIIAQDVAGVDWRWNLAKVDGWDDIKSIRDAARHWHAATHGEEGTVLDLASRCWALAFDLVIENYGALLAVAASLLSSRTARTGPQIRACVNSAPTVRPESAPPDGRTFWVPTYSSLRNWGPAARRKRK